MQETEYTGAGKHPTAQLTFASELGIEVRRGHPSESVPGQVIAIPRSPEELSAVDQDLTAIRRAYLRRTVAERSLASLEEVDLDFLAAEVRSPTGTVREWLTEPEPAHVGDLTKMSIGQRIRAVRTLRGLSSRELAQAAGVSRGLISQIELDRANPSIDTLRRIATSLDSPIASFFDEGQTNGVVVRRNERKTLNVPRSGLTYQLLTPDLNRQIEFIMIELEPGEGGGSRQPFGHPGEEAALVLEGQLHVWIGEEEHVLDAGDSISFNSGLPHRVANLGKKRVALVSAITPPSF